KKNGVWVFGLDAQGSTQMYEADLTGNIALVIGGEHKGIRPLVQKECDFLLSIPNKGRINSLNASVAGGIAMFEALRQRG
ncbi:MAG: 23S rRNA (guanosine(2251)-2'-O)-methyltransferase RlmB, partial [Proteobacteria bacterium]|nr:23S rRNA (guanosine(2251)-2'-O)-methyltransferase RlmB [Pseudomonadota bacterium]